MGSRLRICPDLKILQAGLNENLLIGLLKVGTEMSAAKLIRRAPKHRRADYDTLNLPGKARDGEREIETVRGDRSAVSP